VQRAGRCPVRRSLGEGGSWVSGARKLLTGDATGHTVAANPTGARVVRCREAERFSSWGRARKPDAGVSGARLPDCQSRAARPWRGSTRRTGGLGRGAGTPFVAGCMGARKSPALVGCTGRAKRLPCQACCITTHRLPTSVFRLKPHQRPSGPGCPIAPQAIRFTDSAAVNLPGDSFCRADSLHSRMHSLHHARKHGRGKWRTHPQFTLNWYTI
jgi:hypothetical protein